MLSYILTEPPFFIPHKIALSKERQFRFSKLFSRVCAVNKNVSQTFPYVHCYISLYACNTVDTQNRQIHEDSSRCYSVIFCLDGNVYPAQMWRHANHPATRVDHPEVLRLFSGNFLIMRFRRATSKVRHLTFGRYIVNECRDIICDVTALHVHWSRDLLL